VLRATFSREREKGKQTARRRPPAAGKQLRLLFGSVAARLRAMKTAGTICIIGAIIIR
jgi:hypothetical protein